MTVNALLCIATGLEGEEWGMVVRRGIPVLVVKAGAAVALIAAGVLTAVVVSEWQEGMIAPADEHALASARQGKSAVRVPAYSPSISDRAFFTLSEPDDTAHQAPPWAGLVAVGSAAEARRDAQAREESQSPTRTVVSDLDFRRTVVPNAGNLATRIANWDRSPTGRLVEEIMANEPSRTSGSLSLTPRIEVNAGKTGLNPGDLPGTGSLSWAGGSRPHGESDLYDFTVRFDALGGQAPQSGVDFGVLAGLRAASVFDRAQRDSVLTDPLPVIGGDARYKWSERSMLRASALGEMPGEIRDYVDLRLEQVWRIGGDSSLSLGWRHLRGIMSNELPEPTLREDAILLELKIGF